MKNLFYMVTAAFFLWTAPAYAELHAGHEDGPLPERVDAVKVNAGQTGQIIHVKANGLVCDYCVRAMEKVVMKRPEVTGLKIDLTTKTIDITLKKGQTLSDETVKDMVVTSGYTLVSIERE